MFLRGTCADVSGSFWIIRAIRGPEPACREQCGFVPNKAYFSGDRECIFVPKEVQFCVLESARLCLRTEKSYLAIAAPATAGRIVSGAARSSLLPAKMLDALGTTKESILPSFHLWTNVGSTFVPPRQDVVAFLRHAKTGAQGKLQL